jgi:hypothetical protein
LFGFNELQADHAGVDIICVAIAYTDFTCGLG